MSVDHARYRYWLASDRLTLLTRDGNTGEHYATAGRCVDAASIHLDMAVALSVEGPYPAWREQQEQLWTARLDATLVRSVAWA